MSIRIENSDFYESPVVVGKDNNVTFNSHSKQEINWEMLQDDLIETSAKLPKSSKEYDVSKKALSYAIAKDKKGLTDIIKNNLLCFSSDLFKSVASGVLVEFISYFVL